MILEKVKKCFILLCCIASVTAVSILSYKYADALTEYELSKDALNEKQSIYSDSAEYITNIPEDIPASECYRVKLINGHICVYDIDGKNIFRTAHLNTRIFTAEDIKHLERNGLIFTVRSELVEMLNYLSS